VRIALLQVNFADVGEFKEGKNIIRAANRVTMSNVDWIMESLNKVILL